MSDVNRQASTVDKASGPALVGSEAVSGTPLSVAAIPNGHDSPAGFSTLFDNPLFAGGLGLAALGTAAAFGRRALLTGVRLLRRRLLVNVEISRLDPSYPWILAWLSRPRDETQLGFVARRLTRVNNLSMATRTRSLHPVSAANSAPQVHASFFLQPGYGRHIIRHETGAYIAVNREKMSTANLNTGEPHEVVTLTTLWGHRHVFEHVFREAHSLASRANEGKTVVYSARQMDWAPLGDARKKRPLGSVILDRGVKEGILADVKDFLGRQHWYLERGIPYRRGYLLHGPPGSGKTSFVQALAGELDFSVAMVNLSEIGVTDDRLAYLLTKLPPRTILLLEDADAAFVNRRQRDADGYGGATVTFSGLLNALDGLAAGEERIAFLTTNHIDRLDPALIRPGRIDMIQHLGSATRYQAEMMWDRFYGDVDTDGSGRRRFVNRLDELGMFASADDASQAAEAKNRTSTAAIQGLFLFNKTDMEAAISMADSLIPRQYQTIVPEAGRTSVT
jgi:mitochondrial chaperone BCS1